MLQKLRRLSVYLALAVLLFTSDDIPEVFAQEAVPQLLTDSVPVSKPITLYNLHGDSAVMESIQLIRMGRLVEPVVYKKWWQETMTCSGLYLDQSTIDAIKIYWIDSPAFTVSTLVISGAQVPLFDGYAEVWRNRMYLVLSGIVDPGLVKHEMLHFILYHNGIPLGHPKEYFVDKCHLRT